MTTQATPVDSTDAEHCGRRDFLKTSAATITVAGVTTTLVTRSVVATDSGDPELTVEATIPSNTGISMTVTETEGDDGSGQVATASRTIESGTNTYQLDELEGDDTNYAKITGTLTGGENTPELASIVLDIPTVIDPANFNTTDATDRFDWVAKRADTSVVYDSYLLHRYQPLLAMDSTTLDSVSGLEGYVCRHPDEELTALCYWLRAGGSNSPPLVKASSGLGDHRPIYVYVDENENSVEKVVYAGWYWRASEQSGEDLNLATIRAETPSHPVMEVFGSWHHVRHSDRSSGTFLDLTSWADNRPSWISHGVYDLAAPGTIEDPWSMESGRPSWWRRPSMDNAMAGVWSDVGQFWNSWGVQDAGEVR